MEIGNLKIYYFYSYGEIVECIESDSIDSAKKTVINNGFNIKEIDHITEYDRKFGSYQNYDYKLEKIKKKKRPFFR